MNDMKKDTTLRDVLLDAAQKEIRVRLIGPPNTILAEGFVAFVSDEIVGVKHQLKEDVDEFILIHNIIKVQILGESRQTY